MRASVPSPGSLLGAERQPAGMEARPSAASAGFRGPPEPVRERLSFGSAGASQAPAPAEQLPLLFLQTVTSAREGGARSAESPSLGRARSRGSGPFPPAQAAARPRALRNPGPKPLTPRRTRSRPSVHLWGCGSLPPTAGPFAFPASSAGTRSVPRRQVARAGGDGSREPSRGPRGGRQRKGEGLCAPLALLASRTEPWGAGRAHSPWRCRPRKRPSDRPCPGGGGGSGGGGGGHGQRTRAADTGGGHEAALAPVGCCARLAGAPALLRLCAPPPAPRPRLAIGRLAGWAGQAGARALVLLLEGGRGTCGRPAAHCPRPGPVVPGPPQPWCPESENAALDKARQSEVPRPDRPLRPCAAMLMGQKDGEGGRRGKGPAPHFSFLVGHLGKRWPL